MLENNVLLFFGLPLTSFGHKAEYPQLLFIYVLFYCLEWKPIALRIEWPTFNLLKYSTIEIGTCEDFEVGLNKLQISVERESVPTILKGNNEGIIKNVLGTILLMIISKYLCIMKNI